MRGKFDMDDYISEDYDYEFSRVVSDSEEFSYDDDETFDYQDSETAEMREWEEWYEQTSDSI